MREVVAVLGMELMKLVTSGRIPKKENQERRESAGKDAAQQAVKNYEQQNKFIPATTISVRYNGIGKAQVSSGKGRDVS